MDRTNRQSRTASRRPRRAGGFTLIEAALTTVIIGTGVLAIVAAQQAYHAKNQWAVRTGTGMLLANELRELTMVLPIHDPQGGGTIGPEEGASPANVGAWDDLDDFAGTIDGLGKGAGVSFSAADDTGPINALSKVIPDMEGWRQYVRVEAVQPDNISGFTYSLATGGMVYRVTVDVFYQGRSQPSEELVTSLSWIVARN